MRRLQPPPRVCERASCATRSEKIMQISWRKLPAFVLAASLSTLAAAQAMPDDHQKHRHHPPFEPAMSPLVDKVRMATARYLDIQVAKDEGWVPGTPCVSGPNSGAMGVHYILPARVGDGALKASEPEALIYEPMPSGALRLVGVEFIVLAPDWERLHPEGGTPSVDGHLTHYVGAPNRYGLPAFYELHVWAWENNPNGSFADWNTRVSCDNQPAPPPQ
jgi:hypothetical protein